MSCDIIKSDLTNSDLKEGDFKDFNLESYEHQADIKVASTIPSTWYTDDNFFKKEIPKIFDHGWNLVGSTAALKKKGDYFTSQAGFENFLVVRAEGETDLEAELRRAALPNSPQDSLHNTLRNTPRSSLRGLVNVCRHRAGPVALGCGNTQAFQCRYHGWVYDLNGKLIGTPEFQGVEKFTKEDCPLPRVTLAQMGPLVFASLKPLVSFEEFSRGIEAERKTTPEGERGFLDEELIPFLERDYPVKCNWKVYVDNYLEGYHLPLVHKGLSAELDYAQYKTKTSAWYSEQLAPARKTAALYRSEKGEIAKYFWLFPNTMFNVYQDMVQTNVVIPVSPQETVVKFVWYSTAANTKKNKSSIEELVRMSDVIQEEDRLICEHVQKNLSSSTYQTGRYSVRRENGVHHFHQLLTRVLKQK